MKKKLHIVKIGGNVINDPIKLQQFLMAFKALEGLKILIHGGGAKATQWGEKLSLNIQMVEGRRVTDDQMIDVVTMVYAGLLNKKIVAALQSENCDALGLSGVDANLILSKKRPLKGGIDYGWVGDPLYVNAARISSFIDLGLVPVLAPITHEGQGNLLNTNADTIANVVATAMAKKYEVHLIYAFELLGVMKDVQKPASLIHRIDHACYIELKKEDVVSQGMIPKLDNAFQALAQGVTQVCIIRFDKINLLTQGHEYTSII
jgi:acetylglutamate kinase|tara:strand:+ start:1366 stop:2151 length:786 start_codon:yes stop_codon:yes gene_type:complete